VNRKYGSAGGESFPSPQELVRLSGRGVRGEVNLRRSASKFTLRESNNKTTKS